MATEEPVNPDLLPQAGISYPLKVEYCPNCSMPVGEVSEKFREIDSVERPEFFCHSDFT